MFFRFSHRDEKGKILNNRDQTKVVDEIVSAIKLKVSEKKKVGRPSDSSGTFLRFFDLIEKNIATNERLQNFRASQSLQPGPQEDGNDEGECQLVIEESEPQFKAEYHPKLDHLAAFGHEEKTQILKTSQML